MRAGRSQIAASCSFDQFGHPGLGVDDGFSPLFAEDYWSLGAVSCALACRGDGGLHLGYEGFSFGGCINGCGDEADVFVDVGYRVRSQGKDWQSGFEDRGQGFKAIRDARDDEVWFGGEDLIGVSGPTVVKDFQVAFG